MAVRIGVLFCLVLAVSGCGRSEEQVQAAASRRPAPVPTVRRPWTARDLVGKPMPSFRMIDIQEQPITNESLKGKVVLIDFWATWCGPCRMLSPILQMLHEKYAARGLVVIGANTSERNGLGLSSPIKDWAADYAREHHYTYTFTYGNESFERSCRVPGLPTVFLVDKKGVVRDVEEGITPPLADFQAILEDAVKRLLDKES
jgi:thiol-disulfide isomerase/thioredoxin